MKKHFGCRFVVFGVILGVCHATVAQALITNTIHSQNFDSDNVGELPSGWTGLPVVNDESFVTNNLSVSAPNSFRVGILPDASVDTVTTTFAPHDLSNGDPDNRLSYSLDINVDYIDSTGGEGITLRLWNGVSNLEVGRPRILVNPFNNAKWTLYNPNTVLNSDSFLAGYHFAGFDFDTWYNFRVVINPSSPSSGTALWYMDGVLINTETYSGRSPIIQTLNIDQFDLFHETDSNPATGASMYFDNFLIQSIIPEPSSVVLLVLGGWTLLRRRARRND